MATDRPVVVVGGGIAGLATALCLAPLPVRLVAAAPLGEGGSTAWAQGGVAAALGADDAPELHAADTVAAGGGLVDPDIARLVAREAPRCIRCLSELGAPFDRSHDGEFSLGLEGAHTRRRTVRVGGDSIGHAMLATLRSALVRADSVRVIEGKRAVDLVVERGVVTGVRVRQARAAGESSELFGFGEGQSNSDDEILPARAVVLATGGVGGLYRYTTNPRTVCGSGLALAGRAGATLRDLEFVQFHPTAVDLYQDEDEREFGRVPEGSMPLATEALRGEGARLVDDQGRAVLDQVPGGELASRDVVARAIFGRLREGRRVYLDAREAVGREFPDRFPRVFAACRDAGMDPRSELIPVRPAAHYHMGGVAVDRRGRSDVPGLWACGEVAATGLHGANRLAGNSLAEALVFARRIAGDIARMVPARGIKDRSEWSAGNGGRIAGRGASGRGERHAEGRSSGSEAAGSEAWGRAPGDAPELETPRLRPVSGFGSTEAASAVGGNRDNAVALAQRVALLMDQRVGVVRDGASLREMVSFLYRIRMRTQSDGVRAALLLSVAALERAESRGGHYRADAVEAGDAVERGAAAEGRKAVGAEAADVQQGPGRADERDTSERRGMARSRCTDGATGVQTGAQADGSRCMTLRKAERIARRVAEEEDERNRVDPAAGRVPTGAAEGEEEQ